MYSSCQLICGLAKVAIFTTNVDAENQTLINHKCVCGVLNRHFCQTAVRCWRSVCRCSVVHCLLVSLVRWLGSSFAFFSVDLCVGKKCKCATKCVGCFLANKNHSQIVHSTRYSRLKRNCLFQFYTPFLKFFISTNNNTKILV
jgi:hypothetical protein